MIEPVLVCVPERGHTEIDQDIWVSLTASPGFWRLVEQSIVSITQVSKQRAKLSGSCYVGRVSFPGVRLDFTEKVEGAVEAMLYFATHDAFHIEKLPSPVSDLGSLAALLIRQFLVAVKSYVSEGREFHYRSKRQVGSLIGGRIDITRTVKLRARGLKHMVAYDRSVLRNDTLKNRVLAAALREVERLSRLIEIEKAQVATARSLSMMFSDCHDVEVLFARRDAFVRTATALGDEARKGRDRDLLALASIVLAHESFEHGASGGRTAPRAWFLNLENLFQVSVRRVLDRLYSGRVTTAVASSLPNAIFANEAQQFRANPDLVLVGQQGATAIGDVKYKIWTGSASASDVYQLLVHAAAFKTGTAFLVFPHREFVARDLGISATGCRTWLFAVDVLKLPEHLGLALQRLCLSSEALPAE